MVEAESNVSQALSSIRGRLKRGEIVKTPPIRGVKLSAMEELKAAVNSTNIARSEFTINPEEVRLLDERISVVRSWVLANGDRESITDPEEIDLIRVRAKEIGYPGPMDFSQDPESVCFGYTVGSYSALADLEDLGDGTRLFLIVDDDKDPMEISFDFQNHFSLEIFLEDPDDPDLSLHYDSLKKPLDEMTPEEYRIIQYYLDRYSKEATSK